VQSLEYQADNRIKVESNTNRYPSNDSEIAADDRPVNSSTSKTCIGILVEG
jgi:hypothetical protein